MTPHAAVQPSVILMKVLSEVVLRIQEHLKDSLQLKMLMVI
ncbi:hypothetical protein QW060_19440 [Myroides ceti]|uniref:Uncharacterized protein n=1 Tax=Paenimyroides ceti TaxID=395087 RepID=A0ABT8D1M7_9FLAO|nr:hypothetical protein [Paenimyroides ceti]MDN3709207.1 hypothetical protein [Paenimyroides ceti]